MNATTFSRLTPVAVLTAVALLYIYQIMTLYFPHLHYLSESGESDRRTYGGAFSPQYRLYQPPENNRPCESEIDRRLKSNSFLPRSLDLALDGSQRYCVAS